MVSEKLTVVNKLGFHMRPASGFVKAMAKYKSNVNLIIGDKEIDGKSIMNVMGACIKCGAEIEIQCTGPDEAAMLEAASTLIKSGFGEE